MSPEELEAIAAEMREIGYECDAALVEHVAAHDMEQEEGPIPTNAALAANILAALSRRA